jgi:hypothetical protein
MAFDSSGGVRPSSVHATSVHLTEVHLPALDATSNSGTMQLTLVMAPQRTEPLAAGTQVTDSIEMTGSRPSNFRLALSGAAQQRTIHVEPIVITRSGSGALDISNIVEDVPFVDAHDTLAWRDDYVVQGHTSNQRSVVLDLLSSAGTSVFALQFSQVGIVSAALNPQIAADDTLARVRVELFANRVSVLAPGTTTSSTGTSTSTTTPTRPGAATTVSSVTPTITTPPSTSTTAVTTAAVGTSPTTGTSTTATKTGDQGARDPADFPRIAGLTRTSFTGSRDKTSSSEIGTYFTDASIDEVVALYVSAAKGTAWQETNRYEEGDPIKRTHQIRLVFRKPQSTATVTISDNPQAGTNIRVLIAITNPA